MGPQRVGHDWMTEQQKRGLSRDSAFEYTFLSSHVKSRVSENLASSSLSSPPKMSFTLDSTATVASVKCTCVCSVNQSCPNLGNPMDCSPPGFSVHGNLQARILEWVTFSSSRGSSPSKDRTRVSFVFCTGRQNITTELPGKTFSQIATLLSIYYCSYYCFIILVP